MREKAEINIDIDGVMGDFVGAARKLMEKDHPDLVDVIAGWNKHQMSKEQQNLIWSNIDRAGESFWSEMELLPWAKRLWKKANELGNAIFLTSPSSHPTSAAGKLRWIQKHFGGRDRQFLIGPKKQHCAHGHSILIDDNDHKIEPYRANGGYGILVPQPWNTNRDLIPDREKHIFSELESYAKRIQYDIEEGPPDKRRIALLENENANLRKQIKSYEHAIQNAEELKR